MKKFLIFILSFLMLTSCGVQDISTKNINNDHVSLSDNLPVPESVPRQETAVEETLSSSKETTPPLQEENTSEPALSAVQEDNTSNPLSSTVHEDKKSDPVLSTVSENNTPETSSQSASITVLGLDGVVIYSSEIEPRDGLTVFDLLIESSKEKDVPIAYSGGKSSPYITSIGGLAEKAHGPSSGWIYTVNGKSIMKPCNKCLLSPGDSVEWKYITQFTME